MEKEREIDEIVESKGREIRELTESKEKEVQELKRDIEELKQSKEREIDELRASLTPKQSQLEGVRYGTYNYESIAIVAKSLILYRS